MIELIKTEIWRQLQQKEVSLVMIFDREGNILCHRGRDIQGANIYSGRGFSSSYAKKILGEPGWIEKEYVSISDSLPSEFPASAKKLLLKNLLIQPLDDKYFLYIDSGSKHSFQPEDIAVFKSLGRLLREMLGSLRIKEAEPGGLIGESQAIREIREKIIRYSLEEEPVLILGETGVGKSHIATMIHNASGRKGQFVVIDATTINENLFESEIFGHKKGAFTGAIADKRGLIQEAEHGTVFFDEISEVPPSFQAKLLRLIESRQYRVVGDPREKTANVRIIAASNRDLSHAIDAGEFRRDLFFRLQVLEIRIPPLRERKEDIRLFVESHSRFLKRKQIGEGFWEFLSEHGWPGNIRELFSVMKRAGLSPAAKITGAELKALAGESVLPPPTPPHPQQENQVWQSIRSGRNFWEAVRTPFLQRELKRSEAREVIRKGLEESGGSFKKLVELFHLHENDYRPLLNFIHKHHLR